VSSLDLPSAAPQWSLSRDWDEVGALPSQTREANPASVSAEGGGTGTPTLGGGSGFTRTRELLRRPPVLVVRA